MKSTRGGGNRGLGYFFSISGGRGEGALNRQATLQGGNERYNSACLVFQVFSSEKNSMPGTDDSFNYFKTSNVYQALWVMGSIDSHVICSSRSQSSIFQTFESRFSVKSLSNYNQFVQGILVSLKHKLTFISYSG